MKKIKNIFLCVLIVNIANAQQLKYPSTKKVQQTDDYFGTKVSDPYRWLEDDNSAETAEWVKAQNKVTEDYLGKISFRSRVKERMTQMWNFPKSSAPFKSGNNYFVYTNDGLQNQFVFNIIRGMQGKPQPFLDPNTMSKEGTANISTVVPAHNGKNIAYAMSKAGSDWEEIHVKNIETGMQFDDKLEWVKFSGIAWRGGGFYYSRYDAPDSTNVLKGKNEYHKIYYHTVGQPQKSDELVFTDKEHALRNYGAGTTDDERYLFISGSDGTSGNNLIVQDLKSGSKDFKTIVSDFENDYNVIDNDSNIFYILTNKNAPKNRLVAVDVNNPKAEWKNIIPESEEVLQSVTTGGNYFIVKYMKDAQSILKVYDRKGNFVNDIKLPAIGDITELSADKKDENVFYSLTTFTAPTSVYKYNLNTKETSVYFQPKMDFKSDDYVTEQVFYTSKDGTKVPMFIVHKKNVKLDGNNPTLLFGYGGFNISKTPEFKIERLIFLEQGGVFAMPSLRGGGEYGEAWHEAGTKLKKQNVFDDFISAAEYLIKTKYTNSDKLAIGGRSNGGLLVGAVMTQRPDLFKVAIPTVGVMDMLRYHTFTIGWAWKSDYGSSEDEVNFRNLYSYSPLHNIKEGGKYPATLVTTGDHDDRVVPAHSFKFISTLQEKNKSNNPTLIRIDINAGHAGSTVLGSSKPVTKQIEEQTDIFSFIMFNLGMDVK